MCRREVEGQTYVAVVVEFSGAGCPIKQREKMGSRSGQTVAAVVEQSYKDLTQPAEDKNPLTGTSSHLCTRVLNTSHSRPRSGLGVYREKDQYEEGETKEIHMGSDRREGADKHSNSGVGFSFCRHSVTRSVPSVGSKLIRKLCARPIPGFPVLCSPLLSLLASTPSAQFSFVRLLFSFQSHFMSGKIDTRAGGRDAGKARSDGNGSAKMARAD